MKKVYSGPYIQPPFFGKKIVRLSIGRLVNPLLLS